MMKVRLLTLYIICLTCNLLTAQTVQWSVKPTYSSLEEYVGKLYKYRENGKVGLVDISGKVLVEAKYDSITPFIDYHALALDFQGGNYMLKGIINQYNLKLVEVPLGYFPSKDYPFFSESKLVVYDTNRKYGYLQTDGSFFVKCEYYEAFPFYHGRAFVSKNLKVGEYLKDDGSDFKTEPEYDGGLLFPANCSDFNEDGLALIEAKMPDYSRPKLIIDINGKEVKGAKIEKYKVRTSFSSETSGMLELPSTSHVLPVEAHGLYGFQNEGSDTLCVPAQFLEASSFKDGYAKVMQSGKYGILKLIPDASFYGKPIQQTMEVLNGKVDSLTYILNLPQQFIGKDWELIINDDLGLPLNHSIKKNVNGSNLITILPDVKDKKKEAKYSLSLYVDDLLLWQDFVEVSFTYRFQNNVFASVPKVAEGYNIDGDGCYLADQYDKLEVSSLIENKSDEDIWTQVIMGAKDKNSQKELSVKEEKVKIKANSTYIYVLEIENIRQKYELDVYIHLPEKNVRVNKLIKVKHILN